MSKTTQAKKTKKSLAVEAPTETSGQKAQETTPVATEVKEEAKSTAVKTVKKRSKRYLDAKKKIDVTKFYPLSDAIKLVKETSLSKFDGKVEAHIIVLEAGNLGEIIFPHLQVAAKKIVIFDDPLLDRIKANTFDFDILIATPATMPKLLPFARVLGPKGLMPNAKNGTLTDKPEEAVKKLSVAKTVLKTEAKAPVAHIVVGKVSQPVDELTANIKELIKVITPAKIKKLVLCPTMGPAVKVLIEK